MKYWIFQSNQVLGPYEPDDLSRHAAFGAESLVCPEGRRGTSMGDWQRAGMVPDLSVALVRASQAQGSQTSVATMAGLPPEPTLKDLAILGSLQEKMAMLEDVVNQLQSGLRVKDAELAALRSELAGKDRQSAIMKSAMEREAEELQAQTNEFKRKMGELEDRVGVVARLGETIEKAVEAEKHVEHDVEAHGAAIADITKEFEALRARMGDRPAAAASPEPTSPEPPAFAPAAAPGGFMPGAAPSSDLSIEIPGEPAPFAPAPAMPALPSFPGFTGASTPPADAAASEATMAVPMDPLSGVSPQAAQESPAPSFASIVAPPGDAVAAPAKKSGKKIFAAVGLLAVAAVGAFVFVSGGKGRKKSVSPEAATDAAPLPPPAPVVAAPPPVAAVDPREAAIDAAKQWALPDGRRLGFALETLSPPIGNLSPWMAEPLAGDRVSVNYFAHGGASGAPTVAYEFEVDLAAKTVAGRNPAAKAVIAGKAAPPPAPPKAKHVRIKPRAKAKIPKAKPAADSLDSLLGGDSTPAPKAEAAPAPAPAAAPAPAKPKTANRAAKAAAGSAPADAGKADDEALLDDILKE
ncbi:MAG: hypothetical protein ACHQ49_12250 [Elusimicrobiota bacterium]